jgi:hypothetical protein
MSEATKVIFAIFGVIVTGFVLVGLSKEEPSNAQKERQASFNNYVAVQKMAGDKCPILIKEATKEQVYFPSETKTDRESYITLIWLGENVKTGGFKKASCTLLTALGGVSELIIDDKVIINKKF